MRTKIITKRDTEVPVDYRRRRDGGRWRVYDVIIENVSLVDNYRSQFYDIIETSSLPALLARMQARLRELRAMAGGAGQGERDAGMAGGVTRSPRDR